jgi:hypothetical protein
MSAAEALLVSAWLAAPDPALALRLVAAATQLLRDDLKARKGARAQMDRGGSQAVR